MGGQTITITVKIKKNEYKKSYPQSLPNCGSHILEYHFINQKLTLRISIYYSFQLQLTLFFYKKKKALNLFSYIHISFKLCYLKYVYKIIQTII